MELLDMLILQGVNCLKIQSFSFFWHDFRSKILVAQKMVFGKVLIIIMERLKS